MTRATSKTPAKTRRYRVTFVGPKGGYHHAIFTFKLNQKVDLESSLTSARGKMITEKMKKDGWMIRTVEWYNSAQMVNGRYPSMPNAILLYRLHKNDVYNSSLVKPGWRIVGES